VADKKKNPKPEPADKNPQPADKNPQPPQKMVDLDKFRKLQEYHDSNSRLIDEVLRTRDIVDRNKTILKESKAVHEQAVSELLAGRNDEQLPLLQLDGETDVKMAKTKPTPWRSFLLTELSGLDTAVVNKLQEKGIGHAGDLADFQKEHGEFWAQDIPGVGAKAQKGIEDAMIEFWETHPEALVETDPGRTIRIGKKTEALKAIATCDSMTLLKGEEATGLKEKWRKSAVFNRIDALMNKNSKPGGDKPKK